VTDNITAARVALGLEPKSCQNCRWRHPAHPDCGCMYYPYDPRRDHSDCQAVDECITGNGYEGWYKLWAPYVEETP
jgi:hypothetical protein